MQAYEQLEEKFAIWNKLDPEKMVACSSGTAALQLAFATLSLASGGYRKTVKMPDVVMIACPRAATMAGLTPEFVPCLARNLLMDTSQLNPDPLDPPLAILAVHTYGRRVNMNNVVSAAKKTDSFIVEDLAEAHGLQPDASTDAACWSFYKNKIIAGEEGGAVYFKSPHFAKIARSLRCMGFTDSHDFMHIPGGMNARLSNANASLILTSLETVRETLTMRSLLEVWYTREFEIQELLIPQSRMIPWVYDFVLPNSDRQKTLAITQHLNHAGIAARVCFQPASVQQEYRLDNDDSTVDEIVQRRCDQTMYLPMDQSYCNVHKVKTIVKQLKSEYVRLCDPWEPEMEVPAAEFDPIQHENMK